MPWLDNLDHVSDCVADFGRAVSTDQITCAWASHQQSLDRSLEYTLTFRHDFLADAVAWNHRNLGARGHDNFSGLSSDVEVKRLHFQEFVDAVTRPFTTQPRFLDATERRHRRRDHAGVDTNHARLETLAHAKRAIHVLREDVRGQPVGRRVGSLDHFGFLAELEEGCYRPESLFACE